MQQDIAPTDAGDTSLTKIEANFTELYGNVEDLQDGTQLHALTDKTTPADSDEIGLIDSEDSNVLKKLTWANLHRGIGYGWIPVAVSWSYASADAPTFTITVPSGAASLYSPGMRIKLTQTTVKYFIITAVADTVLTVYGGTDYILTSDAISEISYSTQKVPFGFPLDPAKWTVITQSTDGFSQLSPTTDVWYNAKSLVVPIGIWNIEYISTIYSITNASKTAVRCLVTLSTANNSESDTGMSQTIGFSGASGSLVSVGPVGSIRKTIVNAVKATQYLNIKTTTAAADVASIGIATSVGTTIRAVCAYL